MVFNIFLQPICLALKLTLKIVQLSLIKKSIKNMIISKNNQVHGNVEVSDRTLTSKLAWFLTKICFIPVNVKKDKIHFKIWKTFVYFLIIPIPTMIIQHIFMFLFNNSYALYATISIFETVSNHLFGFCLLTGFSLPVTLGHGLQKIEPSEVFKKRLLFLNTYLKTFIGK